MFIFSYFVVLVTIGFDQTTYSVREDAGNVTISVSVMSGAPVGGVIVTLSTVTGGTATGRALTTGSDVNLYMYKTTCSVAIAT